MTALLTYPILRHCSVTILSISWGARAVIEWLPWNAAGLQDRYGLHWTNKSVLFASAALCIGIAIRRSHGAWSCIRCALEPTGQHTAKRN